jgi:hypothetical protein
MSDMNEPNIVFYIKLGEATSDTVIPERSEICSS